MTVEQKIKSVVDQMKGVTYIFDNWQTANVRLDKLPLPAVLNVLPVSGKFPTWTYPVKRLSELYAGFYG